MKSQRVLKETAVSTTNIYEELPEKQRPTCFQQSKPRPFSLKSTPVIYIINRNSKALDLINDNKTAQSTPTDPSNKEAIFIAAPSSQKYPENNKIVQADVASLCRLCLEEKQTMWPFFSVLTFSDGSSVDVSRVFQDLTGEEKDTLENQKFPQFFCEHCLDLLSSAHTFQQKYEKSMQILNEYLAKECEESDGDEDATEDSVVKHGHNIIDKDDDESRSKKNNNESILHSFEFKTAEEISKVNNSLAIQTNETNTLASAIVKSIVEKTRKQISSSATTQEAVSKISSTAPSEVNTLGKLHRCPICPKMFTALELKKHCQSHQSLKTYLKLAPKYSKKMKFYASPRTENKGFFNQERILHMCPFCQEEFESEPFRDHIILHRSEGNFRCNICNRIFLGINHLKMHQLSHKKEAPFRCKFCNKGFFLKKNYDFHLLNHSDDNKLPFKCNYCDKAFSNPEHLKRHKFNHENDVSYHTFYKREMLYVKCNQCQQKFKNEEERAVHNCKLCCAKCHKLFDSKSKFNSHVCKSKLKMSQCLPCGKVFQLPSSFKTHKFRCKIRTLCYVCGKNVSNITQHLLTHYPNKRAKTLFQCAQCNKQFSFRENLRRHISEVHLNIVRYQCQFCSKGFKGKRNLQVHERIHRGVKAHVCNICNKGFLEKSYLKKHLKVHWRSEGLIDLDVK